MFERKFALSGIWTHVHAQGEFSFKHLFSLKMIISGVQG